jgi:uncharacterized protein YggE/predicted small secreted protein
MRIVTVAIAALLVAALAALAACNTGGGGGGGDDDGDGIGAIRTRQGLSVAAASALAAGQGGAESDEATDSAAPAPGAPDAAVGLERSGLYAPDIAPFPYYPSLQGAAEGITVQGFATAAADADSAIVELYFSADGVGIETPRSEPGGGVSGSSGDAGDLPASAPGQAQPISEADLQPVIDAIVAAGVSRDDVEALVQPYYGDPYYGGSATVRATVRNIDAVDGVVSAATEAASGLANVSFQNTNISYAVSDCEALERAAMEAAVADARARGQTFAGVLGVGLGPVVAASNYSYSLYGGTPCDGGGGVYPLASLPYAEGQAPEVELYATVSVTFAIQ